MGFVRKIMPEKIVNLTDEALSKKNAKQAETIAEIPPIVTERVSGDTQDDYEQRAAKRRGLLSTLLSRRQVAQSDSANETSGSHSTLG